MAAFAHILADSDDTVVKVIIGIIVFVIWGIGALVNLAKKQAQTSQRGQAELEHAMRQQVEEARRRQMASALEEMDGSRGVPPPMMRPIPPPPPPVRPRGPVVPPVRSVPPAPPVRGVRVPFESLGGTRSMPAAPRGAPPMRKQQPQQRRPQKQRRSPVPAVPVPTAERVVTLAEDTPAVIESEIGHGSAPASP